MAAEQRKLLEQLMGASASSSAAQVSLSDPKVCRPYIVGTCAHDLFTNTKQDIGPCSKIHSEGLKVEYEALPDREKKKYGFEYDYMRDLYKYIDDCNQKIAFAQKRLEKTPDEIRQTNVLLKSMTELGSSISDGQSEVELLGCVSEVSRGQDELFRVRQTTFTKAERERELKALSETSGPSGHQKLQVCDVCGAYLSRLDNDRRLADHFYGKMHLGYAQMRRAYDALPAEMKKGRGMGRGNFEDEGPPDGPRGPRGGGGYGGRRGRGGYNRW